MLRKFYLLFFIVSTHSFSHFAQAQSCFTIFTGSDTTIPCTQNCLTLNAKIPDIRSTSNYKVIPYNYNPFPYYLSTGTSILIDQDDVWSPVINLPFTFCFFGINYNQLVVSSNGSVTFDVTYANASLDYEIPNPIPSSRYPRASIFGPFHDIDPEDPGNNSPDLSIQYSVVGTAPCRKFVINYYKIPLFGTGSSTYCRQLIATHQIVLYEGTGLIDVNIKDKPICINWPSPNGGRAIIGIQNFNRTIGIAPPNRNATQWGSTGMNESWRFVPNGGASLFSKVELYSSNTLLGIGDTTSLGTGELNATFNNVCTTSDTTAYRVIATYKRCDNPANSIVTEDTIRVLRTGGAPVIAGFAPASCASGGLGIITVTSPVGPTYEYSINSGATYQSSPVFNAPGGAYNIIARNTQSNCIGSTTVTVPVIETIRFAASVSNAACYGTATGRVTIATQAGAAPFQFSGNGGATYQSANLLLLPAGTHIIRVRDNNNCTKDTTVTISQPDSISIAPPVVNAAFCSGNADGQIIVTVSGGTPAYRYSLTNAAYQTGSTLFANVGAFTVYVKDANNCVDSIINIAVLLNDTMQLAPLADTSVCIGSSITIAPNTNATTFVWSPTNFISSTTSATPALSPQDTTTYYLLARLGTLCSRTDTFVVNVLKRPIPNAGPDTTICFGTKAFFNATAIRGNKYRWIPAANLSNSNIPNPTANGFAPITYVVEVTDPYGCGFKDYDTLRLTVRPRVRAYAGQDTTATLGTPVQLFGCCMDLYQWTPSSVFINDTARNPIGSFPPGTTQVIMITTTPEGCEGRDTVLVKGYQGPTYYVPSGFSPGNRDGRNDVFRPIPVGITETYYFTVFNRYGQLIYTTKTFLQGWDGKWKGELQPEGAYVWMVRGKGIDGKVVEQKGTVVLMR